MYATKTKPYIAGTIGFPTSKNDYHLLYFALETVQQIAHSRTLLCMLGSESVLKYLPLRPSPTRPFVPPQRVPIPFAARAGYGV